MLMQKQHTAVGSTCTFADSCDLADKTCTIRQVNQVPDCSTGAQVMSLLNKDENKTFGAVFRTPVENSKGIPHILEHSVLCGSKKYPIKEPFVELMKGSLNTFLNAFTYPDRTCYPVASTNLQVSLHTGLHYYD